MFISNTATAVLMAPIALVAAQQVGVSPYAFLFAVTLGASMCFASPFSTPPNALVMKAGGYTFMDYVKVGLPLQIIIGIVMTFVLPLLFPYQRFVILVISHFRLLEVIGMFFFFFNSRCLLLLNKNNYLCAIIEPIFFTH